MNNQAPIATQRTPAKSHAVVHQLRQHIVSKLKPGSQLPTFGEMEQSFGVSRGVLREAVDRLKHDGFIYSIDRRGLYVTQRPPHLSRLALVFSQSPSCPTWPRFFTALQQEAAAIQENRDDIDFAIYYNVTLDPPSESYDRLCRDIQAQRLAGVLLMPGTHALRQIEPVASTAVPRLFICGDTATGCMPSITVDSRQMYKRMRQWLHERGRTRVAAVAMYENCIAYLPQLRKPDVTYRPHWAITVGRENAPDVSNLISLLMDYAPDQRPDGLMILDDNLTEHAISGLIQGGVRIGQDLDVITHCNWPWPVPSLAPVKRIGFHARHLLELAIHTAEQLKQGLDPHVTQVRLPALFEDESTSSWSDILSTMQSSE